MSYQLPSKTITFEAALRDLATGSPRARQFAAQALGDVIDATEKRRAIEALTKALEDDVAEVRAEALGALGELGDPSVIPVVVKKLDDGVPVVRQHAAIALGTIAHPDGFEPLATALREGPADLRFQAVTSLAEIDQPRSYKPIVAALDDRDPQVVGAAALSLGALGDDRAIDPLVKKLDHADPVTRFDVAYALADLGDPRGRKILAVGMIDPERSWDAITALAMLEDQTSLAHALVEKKVPAESVVLAAGKLLGLAPEGPQVEACKLVLLAALKARKTHLIGLAVEQLGEVGGDWALAPLDKLARSGKGAELVDVIATAIANIRERD